MPGACGESIADALILLESQLPAPAWMQTLYQLHDHFCAEARTSAQQRKHSSSTG